VVLAAVTRSGAHAPPHPFCKSGAANLGSEHHCLGIAPTLPLSCPPWRRSTAPRTLGGALDRPRHLSYLPSGPLALDEIKC